MKKWYLSVLALGDGKALLIGCFADEPHTIFSVLSKPMDFADASRLRRESVLIEDAYTVIPKGFHVSHDARFGLLPKERI
jgi:hypothetical protein